VSWLVNRFDAYSPQKMKRLCHTRRRSAKTRQFPNLIRIAIKPARVIPVGKANTAMAITTDAARVQRSKSLAKYFRNRRLFGGMTRSLVQAVELLSAATRDGYVWNPSPKLAALFHKS
jgi:anti-sigma factor RsiW